MMFDSNWISGKIFTAVAVVLLLNGCGGSSSSAPTPPPPPVNQAPTANAGADQVVNEGSAVTLDGSVSTDADGTIATYAWLQTAGTVVTLDEAVPSMPTFTAPDVAADEILTFELRVTDDDGAGSAADSVSITVSNVNMPPTAAAGADQIVSSNDLVTLDGSGSADVDGTVDVYAWTQTGGAAVTLDETNPAMPTFTAPTVGGDEVLTFDLQVTDNEAAMSAIDSVLITINPSLPLPFSDNFADGTSDGWTEFDDGITNASSWDASSGRYVQTTATNDFGDDVTESYRRGTYAYLTDSLELTNYRFEVDVIPRPGVSDDIGIMFRFTDNENYYRFSLNSKAGSARLESKINGTYVTIAHNLRGYLPGQTQQMVVEVDGPLLQVFVNGDALFAAYDNDHATGGIGLYGRDGVRFDNVSLTTNGADPEIVIASPISDTVIPGGPRNVNVIAIARNLPAAGSVNILFFGEAACGAVTEINPGQFTASCDNRAVGNHEIRAMILDAGIEVDRDRNRDVFIGSVGVSDRYDAIGDSLTLGVADNYSRDNLNLTDQKTISFQGWVGPLSDMLTTANGQPNLVGNEGIPGDRAFETRLQRLPSILERNSVPKSNRALLMLGTNDSNVTNPSVSGLGCVAEACNGTYSGHMQLMIAQLQGAGRSIVYVAVLPPAWGSTLNTVYADPLDPGGLAPRNDNIQEYNDVIINDLSILPGVELGPDLFSCFLTPTVNRFSLFKDSLHMNALGYAFVAALWRDAIIGLPVVPPVDPCPTPASIYIVDDLDPYVHGHKQNLLEEGDEYYTDSPAVLTTIPNELSDGVWISQANADNANADASFLNFDAGPAAVTVYIAYDAAGDPPTSATHVFTPAALSGDLAVFNGSQSTLSIVQAAGVTGAVSIGGNKSGVNANPQQGYVVIVVAP